MLKRPKNCRSPKSEFMLRKISWLSLNSHCRQPLKGGKIISSWKSNSLWPGLVCEKEKRCGTICCRKFFKMYKFIFVYLIQFKPEKRPKTCILLCFDPSVYYHEKTFHFDFIICTIPLIQTFVLFFRNVPTVHLSTCNLIQYQFYS